MNFNLVFDKINILTLLLSVRLIVLYDKITENIYKWQNVIVINLSQINI